MDSYADKLKSLSFRRRTPAPKVTTDVHDTHKVDVTEHWSERVDVCVKPDPIRVGLTTKEGK